MKTEQAAAKTYSEVEAQEMVAKAIKQDREFQAQVLRALPVLPADINQGWIENPKGLKNVLNETLCPPLESAVESIPQPEPLPTPLLTEVATVALPAVERFVAADAFSKKSGIKFWLGDNFKNNFFGKTEENVPAATLAIDRLERRSLDAPIRIELTPDREETTVLAHFFELIRCQSKGEAGPLLVNGWANIAYIKDKNDNFWAVFARWRSDDRGWYVGARSVAGRDGWVDGARVLSRK